MTEAEEIARRLLNRSSDVDEEDVTARDGAVEVTVIDRTVTCTADAPLTPRELARGLSQRVNEVKWEQYPPNEGDDDE